MQSKQPGAVGDYTKRLGASARQFAERVHDKDLGQIAAVAEGRRQPLSDGFQRSARQHGCRFADIERNHSISGHEGDLQWLIEIPAPSRNW
jgi:hypothetical protein